ncbi:uncharacterized protein KY384_005409 [Bacidia gigantensis]|uniref:uncharacterized protein n=1 Tax=Bacidia gigantensis TaxID=2732470 RepID=UPI001D05175B|nr:uncharacterized protein KY384_005409 [Bacidia gigantensis]KAG8529928.1 hypothetical protein KY384_005409 [Bacidia gigantensis]
MGNSATKEQRPSNARVALSSHHQNTPDPGSIPSSPSHSSGFQHPIFPGSERNPEAGNGRSDHLTSTALPDGDREVTGLEWRRETKQEREARKLQKERLLREKERERSMREDNVDGGYLVTQGVYTGTEDYNKIIVRQLMIERRLAPFWKGLNDHQESWTENQLVAAAKGLPIPAPDEIPAEEERRITSPPESTSKQPVINLDSLTVPMSSRSQSFNSETSSNQSSSPFQPTFPPAPNSSSSIGSALAKGRSKTLATLTSSSKVQQAELRPREIRMPKEANVNGQRLEAHLYKDVSECPICFLYYPPYLNKTRCCDQLMCSECFVQIKRADPHPPEHTDPNIPPPPDSEVVQDGDLVCEAATCPFCKVPEFGITYEPPPFRRGLAYTSHTSAQALHRNASGMSSSSSLASNVEGGPLSTSNTASRRRNISVSADSPLVITTDQIRPDWAEKLAAARAHTARRSAAATALHTAAYLMGNRGPESDLRSFGPFGRRGLLRRTSGGDNPSYGTSSSQLGMLALMSERSANRGGPGEGGSLIGTGSRESTRRGRVEDLEEMMMMEAIRMSLASEEERRRREEKEAKKDTKKKEKEAKKAGKAAEKAARKAGPYPGSANASTSAFQDSSQMAGKAKAASQNDEAYGDLLSPTANPQTHLERARAQIQTEGSPLPSPGIYAALPLRPSHLRTQSNVSSSASSVEGGSPPGSLLQDLREPGSSGDVSPAASGINMPGAGLSQEPFLSGTPPGGGAGNEPMFNFRSLAAMVGDDDIGQELKSEEAGHEMQDNLVEGGCSDAEIVKSNRNHASFEQESKQKDEAAETRGSLHGTLVNTIPT